MIQCPKCGHSMDHFPSGYCAYCGVKLIKPALVYPDRNKRRAAFFYDNIFLGIFILIGMLIWGFTWRNYLIFNGINLLYSALMECLPIKATWGKKITHLVVVTDKGFQPISFPRAFLRNCCKYLSGIPFLHNGKLLLSPKKQTLHDLIAKTVVVSEEFLKNPSAVGLAREPGFAPDTWEIAWKCWFLFGRIDINSCTEFEMTALPGIDQIMAQKAVAIREERGGFGSKEEFRDALDLEPSTIELIEDYIKFGKVMREPLRKRKKQKNRRVVEKVGVRKAKKAPKKKTKAEAFNGPVSQFDINSCPEERLATLPGIGPVLAKKAVVKREQIGRFRSLEEFGEVLGLQTHIVERLRPLLIFNSKDETKMETKPEIKGRIIDV